MAACAILVAAGRGQRMGQPKQLLPLGGQPVAAWSLAALVERIVAGGATRQQSVFAALRALPHPKDIVVIHDGARPFAQSSLVEAVIAAAGRCGGAITAIAAKDTIKQADEANTVVSTIPRDRLWAAQTPQAFAYDVLLRAHERAKADGFVGTDDAELVERLGDAKVAIVEGRAENLKITTPEDLKIAECLVQRKQGARS